MDRQEIIQFAGENKEFFDDLLAAAKRGARRAGWAFGHPGSDGADDMLMSVAMEVVLTLGRGLDLGQLLRDQHDGAGVAEPG